MVQFNPEEFKIPIVQGINDIPLPPNFQGNGKGCNGAYYVEKFNKLVDYVTRYWDGVSISSIHFNIPEEDRHKIVGQKLIDLGQGGIPIPSLDFSYSLAEEPSEDLDLNIRLHSGTNLEALEPRSEHIIPDQIFKVFPENYNSAPNTYSSPQTYYWQFKGTINGIFEIESPVITTKWSLPILVGNSAIADIVNNLQGNFVTEYISLDKTSFDLGLYPEERYIYICSPHQLSSINLNGVEIPTTAEMKNIFLYLDSTQANVAYPYWVYQTIYPTFGNITLNLA